MFIDTATGTEPSTLTLPNSGTYTNCSRIDGNTLAIDNPGSDSTFSFPVYWTHDESTWYTSQITSDATVLYHSLGANNIGQDLIKTTIGAGFYGDHALENAGLTNYYSEYCPDGSNPNGQGEWRWYAHTTPGGSKVRSWITGGSYTVAWGTSKTIRVFGSRVFKEISGKPFSSSRVVLYRNSTEVASSSTIDFNSYFGAYLSYNLPVNNEYLAGTSVTYYAKTEHYNGSSWVVGESQTISISYSSNPYGYSKTSVSLTPDTCEIIFTFSTGFSAKFQVNTHGYTTQVVSSSPATMDVSAPGAFHMSEAWTLYTEEGSGNWVQIDHGTVSR